MLSTSRKRMHALSLARDRSFGSPLSCLPSQSSVSSVHARSTGGAYRTDDPRLHGRRQHFSWFRIVYPVSRRLKFSSLRRVTCSATGLYFWLCMLVPVSDCLCLCVSVCLSACMCVCLCVYVLLFSSFVSTSFVLVLLPCCILLQCIKSMRSCTKFSLLLSSVHYGIRSFSHSFVLSFVDSFSQPLQALIYQLSGITYFRRQ